ncbi:MAG: hypothetical protein WEB63_09660 [Cucumibacter sp.]
MRKNVVLGAVAFLVLLLLGLSSFQQTPPQAVEPEIASTTIHETELPGELFTADLGLAFAARFEAVEGWGANKRAERLSPVMDELASLASPAGAPGAGNSGADVVFASAVPGAIDLLEGLTAPHFDASIALAAPDASASLVLASSGTGAERSGAVHAIAETFRSLVDRIGDSPVGGLLSFN